jgi:hypothetical protein
MSRQAETKIQKVMQQWPVGTVATTGFFASSERDVSRQLLNRYVKSRWLSPVGTGAYIKTGEQVGWQGGLYALQAYGQLAVHAGALTALSLQGYAHYVRLGGEPIYLFSPPRIKLPAWFTAHDWSQPIRHAQTSLLPKDVGLVDFQVAPSFSIRISAPERAILECLYLAPDEIALMECYQVLEGLTAVRPRLLQQLLEQCSSFKVKRLFLYLAERSDQDWFKRLDGSKLELGSGARSFAKGGSPQKTDYKVR